MRASGSVFEASFFTDENERGYAFRPLAEGWHMEGRVYDRINSAGYHDREHTIAKPPGVIRIAVVGSSYVAGMTSPRVFVSFLEAALNAKSARGSKFEVMDFGVEAYSAMQSYYTLQKDVWKYSPDVVLFAITPLDPMEDYRGSAINQMYKRRPYFEVDSSENIVPDGLSRRLPPFDPALIRMENQENDLMNHSEIALGFHSALTKVEKRNGNVWGPGVEPNVPTAEPKRILQVLFSYLRRDAEVHQTEVWILAFGMPEQEHPDAKVRADYAETLEKSDQGENAFADRRIQEMAKSAELPAMRLSPALAAYAQEHHAYLHGFGEWQGGGHWNELGNQVAGETIARVLQGSSEAVRKHS